jgi:hypothetical protein
MIHNGLKYFLTHSQSTNSSNVFTSLPVEKEIIRNHNKYSLKNFADSEFKIGETHLINSLNVFIRLPFEMIKTPKLNLTWSEILTEVSDIVYQFFRKRQDKTGGPGRKRIKLLF